MTDIERERLLRSEPRCGGDGGFRARWSNGGNGGGSWHRSGGRGDRCRAASIVVEETGVESSGEETDRDLEFWDEREMTRVSYYL
jgi:hypothetical protein